MSKQGLYQRCFNVVSTLVKASLIQWRWWWLWTWKLMDSFYTVKWENIFVIYINNSTINKTAYRKNRTPDPPAGTWSPDTKVGPQTQDPKAGPWTPDPQAGLWTLDFKAGARIPDPRAGPGEISRNTYWINRTLDPEAGPRTQSTPAGLRIQDPQARPQTPDLLAGPRVHMVAPAINNW